LEGAAWSKGEKRLEEVTSKELYFTFPIIHVSATSTAVPANQPAAAMGRRAADAAALERT